MHFIVKAIASVVLAALVTGQAPGDETPICPLQNSSNVRVLMDSYNYGTLLGTGGVWTAANPDGSETTWSPGSGGNCQRTLFVCEKSPTPNNWIFTQYISKNISTLSNISIFVNITARFTSCNPSCPKSLYVYYYIVNSPIALPNNSNFSLLSIINGTTISAFDTVINFNMKPDEAGFYIALQDRGSCTNLYRVRAYYYRCLAQQVGLVLYPLTPTSIKQNSPVLVTAACANGSINSSSLHVQCDNNGAWIGNVSCSCNVLNGYRLVEGSCTGCGAGQWLDVNKNLSCSPCPGNCSRDLVVASKCLCLDGYFRASMEGPDIGCTSPPTVPKNLTITLITNMSVSLMWKKPDIVGRDDYYFVVKYRTGSFLKFITTAFKVINKSNVVTYTLYNLTSYTNYEISVTAANGVSDQDWYNECIRTATITTATFEGVPGVVEIALIGQYVVWQRPISPNGIITGYSLQVVTGSQSSRIIRVNATTFVYQVQSADIPSGGGNAYVQVSALTNAGNGQWSIPQLLTLSSPGSSVCTASQSSVLQYMSSCTAVPPTLLYPENLNLYSLCSSVGSCIPCSTTLSPSSYSMDATSSVAGPLPALSSMFWILDGSSNSPAQLMEENGMEQNVLQIYLGVAAGVIIAVAGAVVACVCVSAYIIRRDYKRKKFELANATARRKTDNEIPLETMDNKQ